jgi:hypothetical protein
MSGGQRQAVAIARTRLSRAKIVLMDEPTAAISVRQVAECSTLIRGSRPGIAIVLISHRMPDVTSRSPTRLRAPSRPKGGEKPISASSRRSHRLITGAIMPHDATVAEPGPQAGGGGGCDRRRHGHQGTDRFERCSPARLSGSPVALVIICVVMTILQPDAFASRAISTTSPATSPFIGIMAIGMTAVIITGGIDLSSAP